MILMPFFKSEGPSSEARNDDVIEIVLELRPKCKTNLPLHNLMDIWSSGSLCISNRIGSVHATPCSSRTFFLDNIFSKKVRGTGPCNICFLMSLCIQDFESTQH